MTVVRFERPDDSAQISWICRVAFSAPDEVDLVGSRRDRGKVIILLVAEADRLLAGHIPFRRVTIEHKGAISVSRRWRLLPD